MQNRWSWIKGGIILGIFIILATWSYRPVGVSSSYSTAVSLISVLISEDLFGSNPYLLKYSEWGWQEMLVIGIFFGGLISCRVSGGHGISTIPDGWKKRFGASKPLRFLHAFLGGFLIIFGARMAGGCTSGHIISGGSLLIVGSLVFGLTVYISGIIMAKILYNEGIR